MVKLYFNKNLLIEFFLGFLIVLFVFFLFFRGTIAFSNLILSLFFILIVISNALEKKELNVFFDKYKKIFIFLMSFIIWIIIQPYIIDSEIRVVTEIRGQFIIPIAFFCAGILIAISKFKYLNYQIIFNLIYYTGFLHVFLVIVFALSEYFLLGYLPIRKSYLLEIREMSYFTNLIYAFFLAEIYIRLQDNKKFLYFNNLFIPLFLFIFVFSVYLQGMRWGVITFCFSSVFFFLLYFISSKINRLKKILISSSFIFVLLGLATMNIEYDKRWNSFMETISITLNDKSLYWIDKDKYPCPKLKSGECVDLSNYLRLKQFIEGVNLIVEYPMGNGYSRHSYQYLVNKIYKNDDNSFNFPHSGIINLFLGVGILGMILYLSFVIFLISKLLSFQLSYPKIFTIFFIISFHSRALVDMTFMNHNLKIYFFILGIGMVSSLYEDKRIRNEKTKINQSK